nr:twin-arginine translocation signal domain-containing protein [Pyrinomonadaceae bacterium]
MADQDTPPDQTRRNFLAALATTGAVATLVNAQNPSNSSTPVLVAPYPVVSHRPAGEVIKIICTERLSPAEVEQIRSAGKNIELRMIADRSELKDEVAEAEIILGSVDRETVLTAKKLRWVQSWGAGVEGSPNELMEHPCVLTN